MTAAAFRRLALSLAGVQESAHNGHPDFRVGKRIIATLGYPDARHGMVVLSPDEQRAMIAAAPAAFAPAAGAWGRKGSTLVVLDVVTTAQLRSALAAAWNGGVSRQ